MKLTVLTKTDAALDLEFEGEDDTLLNLLKSTLLKDTTVSSAFYRIEKPFTGKTIFHFEVSKGAPGDALNRALAVIKDELAEFRKHVEKL